MNIKDGFRHQSDIVFGTVEGATLYKLAEMKANIKLESIGVKKNKVSYRSRYAKELGLKQSDDYDKFLNLLVAKMDGARREILVAQMKVDRLAPELIRVMSCDRAAHISNLGSTWRISFDTNNPASGTRDVELADTEEKALCAAKSWVLEIRR